ncbi:efflux RND transporter periplasmic adaptor subunit [Flammeovirga agarivorans]|uniref:Efflux RND transporter periplasmic adaptor subunit n=1 Tax=Flammeovirga agarivorans TaxID=2726742 RepID=A0A7X8XW85_9BACT|nr:efflux RND transporter periplasmic adaptor subunit [Flammeovirga agarivorans]NLR91996.1 efflux RND transporter periplasmic adaptor subunit [Flammeovirga agarivorans]
MKNLIKITLSIWLSISFFSCQKEEETKEEIIRPVRYKQVFYSGGEAFQTFAGVSKAGTESDLSFRVSGVLTSIRVVEGDVVKKGQLIATIDDSDAKIAFQQVVAQTQSARVQLETAKANLDRTKKLYEANNVSLSEYEQAKNAFSSSKASFETSQQTEDLKRRELGYYKLYVPMNGIIAEKIASKNENIKAGNAVVKFASGNDLEIKVGIPEKYISKISNGDKVSVSFTSVKGKKFTGRVTKMSYVSDVSSTFPVTVLLDTKSNLVRPGMSANVTFQVQKKSTEPFMIVPVEAVNEDVQGEKFVFVVKKNDDKTGTVHMTKIKIGELRNNGFIVLSGLKEGDSVVTSGVTKITDGLKVKFLPKYQQK